MPPVIKLRLGYSSRDLKLSLQLDFSSVSMFERPEILSVANFSWRVGLLKSPSITNIFLSSSEVFNPNIAENEDFPSEGTELVMHKVLILVSEDENLIDV